MKFPEISSEEFAEYWHLRKTALLYFKAMALHKACEIDLFGALEEVGGRPDDVARLRGVDATAVARLLESLAAMKLLKVSDDKLYSNTPAGKRFLVGSSDLSQRSMIAHAAITPNYLQQYDRIFTEGPQVPAPISDAQAPELVAAMNESALLAAPRLLSTMKIQPGERVLDLGGGAGTYSIYLAQKYSDLEAVVIDRPAIIKAAQSYVQESAARDRIQLRGADFNVDPLGEDYSLVLLVTVIHYLSREALKQVIRRASDTLRPGGRLVVSDILLSGEGDGPLGEALYSIRLMITTDGGGSHSVSEVQDAMKAAGLSIVDFKRLEPSLSSYVVGRKPD